jgi:hypothetical protein
MIVGNYRTGTTYLCQALSFKYPVRAMPEPTVPLLKFNDSRQVDKLKSFIANKNNKFVLKVQADQMDNIPEYRKIWNGDSYKILVYRKNKIDQILSYYIARVSGVWNTLWLDRQNSPELAYHNFPEKILISQADYVYNQIVKVNEILETMKVRADMIISYEEIDFDYSAGDPNNFDKLPILPNIDIVKKNLLDYYDNDGRLEYLNSEFILRK